MIKLIQGDCLEVMATLAENSVDTIITDPPYGLEFMGKDWDHGIPGIPFWTAALRVAKPGATLMAFGGSRTHHRLMCAIEDAGWEIRDVMMWVYGSGFPKSHDIGKAIDATILHGASNMVAMKKANRSRPGEGRTRAHSQNNGILGEGRGAKITNDNPATPAAQLWDGWGTALKPAWELIIIAQKPRDGTFANNALTWGVAGLNIDGGRVGLGGEAAPTGSGDRRGSPVYAQDEWTQKEMANGGNITSPQGRWPANLVLSYPEDEYELRDDVTPDQLRELAGWLDENA